MRKSLLLTVLMLFFVAFAWAQKKEIRGRVIDSTGSPLQGATIISDKKNSATTDANGNFTMRLNEGSRTLVISHTGFGTQSLEINESTNYEVRLQPSANVMEDVVVIGYGTQRKSHLTGAITKVKTEKIDEAPVARIDQALQGKVAGVQIQNISSEAGSDPKIRVRGISSINAGADPLVVVDGHPVPDGLSFVNPADVESIEVLKDAASAAIYGSRGASGVIIITTKSGKADRPKYTVKASAGQRTPYETYPMMSMTEYGNLLFYEASLRAQDPKAPPLTTNNIMAANERAAYVIENTIMGGKPTDWQDAALRNAQVRNILMSVTGGKKDIRYFISGAYQKDQGMMYHSEFDRLSLRTKVDAQLSNRVKLTLNLNPSYTKRERPSVNYIDFVRFYSFLPVYHTEASAAFVNQEPAWAHIRPGDFAQARHFNNRIYSGTMPDGSTWVTTTPSDPFATSNNTPKSTMENRTIKVNDYRVQSSADLGINIIPGLDFKTLASIYVNYSTGLDFAKRNATSEGSVSKGVYNDRLFIDLLWENTVTYNRSFKDHSFTALAGFTAQKSRTKDEQSTGLDYPSDNITTLNNANFIDKAGTYTLTTPTGLLSYLGRINYSFKDKYLFSASFRRDGSSYFAPGKKWGNFPAVSIGWMMSEESFLKNVAWINSLKIRASYGVSGNNRIQEFAWVDLLFPTSYILGTGSGTQVPGQAPSTTILANPDITWERTFQFNAGIDASLFNGFLGLSIDAYQSKSDQLLLRQNSMAITGVPQTWNNIGVLQNRGVEVEVTTNNIRRKNFKWTTSGNISVNRNKLLELYGDPRDFFLNQGERTELYQNKVGDPFIQFFGYVNDGVWLSQADIDTARSKGLFSALSNYFAPGGLRLKDLDGNDTIDIRDRQVIGSPYPDFTWGITNTLTYKGFDLSFTFQGSHGGQLVNGDPNYNETKRTNRNYNQNRWLSPMFPGDGRTPYSTVGFNWMLTDYVVESASYFALREVIVGFTLPQKFAKAVRLNGARLYASAQNLFYKFGDNYRGINPEARYTGGPYSSPLYDGYQRGSFPLPTTFLVGIDLNF